MRENFFEHFREVITISNLKNYILFLLKSCFFTFLELPSMILYLYHIKMHSSIATIKVLW
jgi:hypothetical protein